MQAPETIQQQGVFTCDDCGIVLWGYDAWFTYCNNCQSAHLTEVHTHKGYCGLHPGCGCQSPDECTEE